METTERIVEAYVRYVRGWATIPNLRCSGQKEIDLFAIDPVTDERWHIETSVSISSGFSALTNDPFEPGEHKSRVKAATARRKLGFFLQEKFLPKAVEERLACFGCGTGKVRRAIVTWEWKEGVQEAAAAEGIELWGLPILMQEIADKAKAGRAYLSDDILRTIDLYARGLTARKKSSLKEQKREADSVKPISEYTDTKQLQTLMANAKRQGRDDVYHEAFRRRCELEGVNYDDPLEKEFYATLAAYEQLLAEKNGRTTLASYTRRKLRAKGVVGCLQDWAMDTKETDGFKTLVARGMVELTGEYLVTKYPQRFTPDAVRRAAARLSSIDG